MGYRLLILKRIVEDIFIFPFVWWGRRRARMFPIDKEYDIFFFFPFHHIGGAEKVHAGIANALKGKKALIVFTRKSKEAGFLEEFKASGHQIMDVSALTDNKFQYWNNLYYRGVFSGYINAQKKKTVVFNGQSNFAYKLSRWIRKDIPQIELIHSFSSFSYIRLPFLPYFTETVMISRNRITDHLRQYRKWGVPNHYDSRIQYILNGIELPPVKTKRQFMKNGKLQMMYVGRATPEKRVELTAGISRMVKKRGLAAQMHFVGEVDNSLTEENIKNDTRWGNISNRMQMQELYKDKADVLFITSSEEGFPMVIMEAMSWGSIIIATPVGDIPLHIKPGINGFLFSSVSNEEQIISEGAEFISKLINDPLLCQNISNNNLDYAFENFGLATFEQHYRTLIESYLI